jgi:hypothetical protein
MTAAKWCQLPIWSFGTDKAKIIFDFILELMRIRVKVFNTTFNNISVILWQSVLLPEYPENTTNLAASH